MYLLFLWPTLISCSSAVKEASCDGEVIQQLQKDCISHEMVFKSESTASDLIDCSLGVEQGAASASGSGDCKIQGEGECAVTCTFPENNESNTDEPTNTNTQTETETNTSTDQDNDGFSSENGDCDDNNPNINPEANEIPANGTDENCDGQELCYIDEDRDGFGIDLTTASPDMTCTNAGVSTTNTDCFDLANSGEFIFPGAAELESITACMQDEDEDGYGNATPPQGVTVGTDCDDGNGILNSSDLDLDGFSSCDGDCDDIDSNINPDAVDAPADGIDQDCNGLDATCYLTSCDQSVDLGNGFGMDFVLIDVSNGDPLGNYTLSNNFYMMTTEVTQGQFSAVQSYYNVTVDSSCYGVGVNYPANYASWHEFVALANALSVQEGLTECYSCSGSGRNVTCTEHSSYSGSNVYNCPGYRLPTEAEWELAVRSDTIEYFWTLDGGGGYSVNSCNTSILIQDGASNPPLSDYAWFCGNHSGSCGDSTYGVKEVAEKLANGFVLYDMHGNIAEWTADYYGCSFPESSLNPICTSTNSSYILRGGHFNDYPYGIRTSRRHLDEATARSSVYGARLIKSVF